MLISRRSSNTILVGGASGELDVALLVKVMLMGLNRFLATSVALRTLSMETFEVAIRRNRAPSGTSKFFGMRPAGVKLIVMNGFGLGTVIPRQEKVSSSSISHIRNPLSLVSPKFCCTVEPQYRTRPSLSRD